VDCSMHREEKPDLVGMGVVGEGVGPRLVVGDFFLFLVQI
jgi:hypothetical protein